MTRFSSASNYNKVVNHFQLSFCKATHDEGLIESKEDQQLDGKKFCKGTMAS